MPASTLSTQLREFRYIWDELLTMQPRMRAALPADLAKARIRLRESNSEEGKPFGDHQLFVFYRIATLIERHGVPLAMRELSEELAVPLSTATRMVDWLVESGYIERLSDPDDRRVVRVALSPAGKKLAAAFNEFFNQRIQEFLRHFTPQERQNMLTLMHKVVEVLRTF